MPEDYPWYSIVEDQTLLQGDLLKNCPVLLPKGDIPDDSSEDEFILDGEILEYDVIVMSQSCDLEAGKLDLVLVCPHWPLVKMAEQNDIFKSSKGKQDLQRGNIPGYHVLRACDFDGWHDSVRIVDFRNVYSLPYQFLKRFATKHSPRLRLLPPYREHLAQAFARFFMRVGLPIQVEMK